MAMIYYNIEDYLNGVVDMYNYSHQYKNGSQMDFYLSDLNTSLDSIVNQHSDILGYIKSDISTFDTALMDWLIEEPVPKENFDYKFTDFNDFLCCHKVSKDLLEIYCYGYIQQSVLESLLVHFDFPITCNVFELNLVNNNLYTYQKGFVLSYQEKYFIFEMFRYDYQTMQDYFDNHKFWE